MKMTRSQLARCARNLLKTMEERGLESLAGLEAASGEAFDPDADDEYHGEEYVSVEEQLGSFIVGYVRRVGQVPIRLRVAPSFAKIMLTCTEALDGFEVFEEEPELGKMQDRKFSSYDEARKELRRLAELA